MLLATLIVIVSVAVFIMSYAVVVFPLEYTVDTLQESYEIIADNMSWTDTTEVNNQLGMMPWFLAGSVAFGIILLIVWLFAWAQKKEYERYR
jgi:flagellar biosynthesis/type III secretory pathway M-ring protein FliF/YscJ